VVVVVVDVLLVVDGTGRDLVVEVEVEVVDL
jgi:hypothetical protein